MGSETIKVLVGKEHKLYQIHKTLICSCCPYFQKCLDGNFEEGYTGEVVLEEEETSAFDNLVLWLYCNLLPDDDLTEDAVVHTHLLADKLCMEGVKNYVVDRKRESDWNYQLPLGPIK